MTIFNLGSINIDRTYRVPHLPGPGETLGAYELQVGLGGKGANMSVAAARAAGRVVHIGAVGEEGRWASERLLEYGVDTRHVALSPEETGHAIIAVDDAGENLILVWPGANRAIAQDHMQEALTESRTGDIFLTQNETNGQTFAARRAADRGLRIVYAAAPFSVAAVREILPLVDLLVLNEVEAAQLTEALGVTLAELATPDIVITLGARGCRHMSGQLVEDYPAFPAKVVDTTGAGDTFTGYLVACLDRGQPITQAIRTAQKAGALMVSRLGTADVIPDLRDIEDAAF